MQQTFAINTGNPQTDAQQLAYYQQQYIAQGLQLQVVPQPTGGFICTVVNPAAPPAAAGYPAAPAGAAA